MTRRQPFQYAALRVIPRIERGEAVNAGVVLFCRPLRFLGARMELDDELLAALAPDCDPDEVRMQLDTLVAVAEGRPEGGRLAGRADPVAASKLVPGEWADGEPYAEFLTRRLEAPRDWLP